MSVAPPDATSLPSGLKATQWTLCLWALEITAVFFPLATSQNLMVLSVPPETKLLPSRLNAIDRTPVLACPSNETVFFRVATSHNFIVLLFAPYHPDAIVLPSGLNA